MVQPNNEIENRAKISALEVFNLLGFSCILPTYNPQATTTRSPPKKTKITTASRGKGRFNQRFPHINIEFFSELSRQLLLKVYPKVCPHDGTKLSRAVGGRETSLLCPKCYGQTSLTAFTPLHHLKTPLWVFGFLIFESVQRYPLVLSSKDW